MRTAFFLVLATTVVATGQTPNRQTGEKKQKVKVIVHSWLVPLSLASDLKAGKRITDVEVKPSKGKKVNLSEVIKGKDDLPPTGDYELHRVMVFKGKDYNTHDFYVSASLPQGTKLTNFVYKGTFTGTMGGEKHKFTYFEATAASP
jgi:hypothetical protein